MGRVKGGWRSCVVGESRRGVTVEGDSSLPAGSPS